VSGFVRYCLLFAAPAIALFLLLYRVPESREPAAAEAAGAVVDARPPAGPDPIPAEDAAGAAPQHTHKKDIRLRVGSLRTFPALALEAVETGAAQEKDLLRVYDAKGSLLYSAGKMRVTARGNTLFIDGEEAAAPLAVHPATGWSAPISESARGTCATVSAPVRLSAGRDSYLFAGHPLQVYAQGGELIVIAALPLEEYIAGVLAVESGPYSLLPRGQAEQYLAAQAVACRSYAVYFSQSPARRHGGPGVGYDFCDSTHCQAWRQREGAAPRGQAELAEYPESILDAVRKTTGMVLALESGEYAPGFYSSTAAASTVLPSEVWGGTELDRFFQPVTNALAICGGEDNRAKRRVGSSLPSTCAPEQSERGIAQAGLLNIRSPHASWEWRENKNTFRNFLRNAFAIEWDGALPKLDYSPRGAARSIRFGIRGGGRSMLGHVFRDEFCRARDWGSLRSLHFSVRFERDSIVFSGSGLGHGVGLCQYGAMELARIGRTWEEILRFYYPKLRCVFSAPE